jgi:hypothetical protein
VRITAAVTAAAIAGVLALGKFWWNVEADAYRRFIAAPWQLTSRVTGCTWQLGRLGVGVLPDHGHDMHLFLVRVPDLDTIVHVHPVRGDDGVYVQQLPSLPAGRYAQFADIVLGDGFPVTGTGELELPALDCAPLAGDDSTWRGRAGQMAMLAGGAAMIFERPEQLNAGAAQPLAFRVVEADGSAAELEPYMGMLGHAVVVRADATVFAHLHPSGSIAMPALALADPHAMHAMHAHRAVSRVAFPYGFPRAGAYRVFVQVKLRGRVETGVFDVTVD